MAMEDLNSDCVIFSRKYFKDIVRDEQSSEIEPVKEIHESNLVYWLYFET